jgi:fatty acid/phospholipid biosynthesis enzyme
MYLRAISAGAKGAILDFSVALFHEIENVNRNNILYVFAFF